MERGLLDCPQVEGAEMVASGYARQMAKLFPKMVRRAETLRALPTSTPVPTEVQQYLREASKCYIFGHFIACLLVCRSAIEFGLRDFLVRAGKGSELEFLHADRGDTLFAMIRLARTLRWTLQATLDDADEVRRIAKDAVHQRAPDPEICKELFIKTRGVLKELYS